MTRHQIIPSNLRRPTRHELVKALQRMVGDSPAGPPDVEAAIIALKVLELERAYTRARGITRVGKAQEKKQGQPLLSREQIAEVRKKMELGLRPFEIAKALGISRSRLYVELYYDDMSR